MNRNYVALIFLLIIFVSGCVNNTETETTPPIQISTTYPGGTETETTPPIQISTTYPGGIESGLLDVNETLPIHIWFITGKYDFPILNDDYSARIELTGSNVSPDNLVIWEGIIKEGYTKEYDINITPLSKTCSLDLKFKIVGECPEQRYSLDKECSLNVPIILNNPNINSSGPEGSSGYTT